jgi:hypothetical protein
MRKLRSKTGTPNGANVISPTIFALNPRRLLLLVSANVASLLDAVTAASVRRVRGAQGILRCVCKYAAEAQSTASPHDLRRTYAKLAHTDGAKLDQIRVSLGHTAATTPERYLGRSPDLHDAPCDYLQLDPIKGRKDRGGATAKRSKAAGRSELA